MWHHELILPTDFGKRYPEILNENGDMEVTHPLVKDYLENKIYDFFDAYPKMDGMRAFRTLPWRCCRITVEKMLGSWAFSWNQPFRFAYRA